MVLTSAGILCTQTQGHAQDNPSAVVKDHGGRKIKTVIKPDYPTIARQMRVTGTVRLEATVAADGKVRVRRNFQGDCRARRSRLPVIRRPNPTHMGRY